MASPAPSLAYLLDLDGEEIIYGGGYVARFKVREIDAIPEKPHGISYSLTFHAPDGRRPITAVRFKDLGCFSASRDNHHSSSPGLTHGCPARSLRARFLTDSFRGTKPKVVMPVLDTGIPVPGSHDIVWFRQVDARVKSGYDDFWLY